MTPQEKKSLSLKRDRRNTYGRNDKASRKVIRKRKRWGNQSFRRSARQVIRHGADGAEELDDAVRAVARKPWKKTPDQPLGAVLRTGLLRKLEAALRTQCQSDREFFPWLEQCLRANRVRDTEVQVVMRRAKAVALSSSARLDVPLPVARVLEHILARRQRSGAGATAQAAAISADALRPTSLTFSREWRRHPREWHQGVARVYAKSPEDIPRIDSVVDAACDLLERLKPVDVVKTVFIEAFARGGSGVSNYAGTLVDRLSTSHPSLAELWGDLCQHPSAEVRLRALDFLPHFPAGVRARCIPALLDDPDLAVRVKAGLRQLGLTSAQVRRMLRALLAREKKSRNSRTSRNR